MIDLTVTVQGLDKIISSSAAIQKAVDEELSKGTYACAQQIATDYKKSVLAGGKSGRIYKYGAISHQASAPGEAPASNTGRLVNAISVMVDSASSSIMKVATKYAMMLEVGTSKMAARPAAVPAMEQNRAWIIERIALALKTALSRGR
ncbi:HK97-gp10 family putative phage morphogenesis protein [Zavarzinella formosa]|uniref:HK97-gp10 family putative phage morphogenesis protein n=1 Tax=Zavarzinella formosa TaxID=360055 RepID=UPI0002DF30D6|nr:HK97-gp10 family putative phage morphogenesis protein [Zavarzinella formosa]